MTAYIMTLVSIAVIFLFSRRPATFAAYLFINIPFMLSTYHPADYRLIFTSGS